MNSKKYINFDLVLSQREDNFSIKVTDSPVGQASGEFRLPFSQIELELFVLKTAQNRGNVRTIDLDNADISSVKDFGGQLYNSIFTQEISECFKSSLAIAKDRGHGLRLRFQLSNASELVHIPWELLYNPNSRDFLCLSENTPIIRRLELNFTPKITQVSGVINVLVMISSPEDQRSLDTETEWQHINKATRSQQHMGRIRLKRVAPSLPALLNALQQNEFHVFHYIGHSGFDTQQDEGVLLLEGHDKKSHKISGQELGTILYDQTSIQLALLNSCSGARVSKYDPFAGVGQSLLQKGIPAVVAMQFEITDSAAITFSREFYNGLVQGYAIDRAVAAARRMIFAENNQLEWATPVLYANIDNNALFDKQEGTTVSTTSRFAIFFRPATNWVLKNKLKLIGVIALGGVLSYGAWLKFGMNEFASRYISQVDGTVSDRVTNLMWKMCSEGHIGQSCSGTAKKFTWDEAIASFETSESFAGYDDWRLPVIDELQTLGYCSNDTPEENNAWFYGCDGQYDDAEEYQKPTIVTKYFPNTKPRSYWSSTPYSTTDSAWVFRFGYGNKDALKKTEKKYVRLVRSEQ